MFHIVLYVFRKRGDIAYKNSPVVKKGEAKNAQVLSYHVVCAMKTTTKVNREESRYINAKK